MTAGIDAAKYVLQARRIQIGQNEIVDSTIYLLHLWHTREYR